MSKLTLRPFQKLGVDDLLSSKRRLLRDEMGCGKSVQVLGGIDALLTKVDRVNVLIVCPAALCLMWEKMISDWFASECQVVLMKKQGKEVVKFSGVKVRAVIVSYNYLQKPGQVERLKKCKWGVVVADEAHKLKSWGKKTSKGFQTLVKGHEGYVWMLTGSPATNSGQDYYVYLQTCEPGKHGSYLQFSERFCEKTINWFTRKWEYKGVKKDKRAELGAIFKRLGLRRKLEEVAPELPAKIFTDIPVAMPESVVKKFLELKKRYAVAIEAGEIPRDLPGELADLRLEIGLIKSEVAVEYVLNAGRPMIVFTQRIETADKISSSLMEQGIRVGKITGAESGVEKDSSVTRFQAGELDVIVANIAAGGVGLTLTRANTVLFAELTSSPAEEGQAIGRINRIGQKAKVLQIIKLKGEKSVDSSIEKSLLYKGEFMSEVMGD